MTSPIIRIPGVRVRRLTIAELLFSTGVQGAMYHPHDLSTLSQDSAGTTPVTAMEQPVGRMLDISGNVNHAFQGASGKRPVVSRRVNLLTKTEGMTPVFVMGEGWTHGAFGHWILPLDLGAQLAPDGTSTAVGIRSVGASGVSSVVHRAAVQPGASLVFRVWVRKVEGENQSGIGGVALTFQTGNNDTLVDPYAKLVLIGGSVTDTWKQFQISYTTPATGVNQVEVGLVFTSPSVAPAAVALWGASLTLATDAHIPYQWVNTATDYDSDPNKFPTYLRFDGAATAMQTNAINFTGTDKMTVVAGVQWNNFGDTTGHMVVNHNSTGFKSFFMIAPSTTANAIASSISGSSAYISRTETGLSAGAYTAVLTQAGSLTPASLELRRNSLAVGGVSGSTGGGSFANTPLFIGSQSGGATRFFNGRLYGLIVRGAQTPLSQIETTEAWMAAEMRLPS